MEDLNLKGNSLTNDTSYTVTDVRSFTFACIANLKIYNRTKVQSEEKFLLFILLFPNNFYITFLQLKKFERKVFEWEYVKSNGTKWRKAGGHQNTNKNSPDEEFCKNHPRYAYLLSGL